MEANTSLLLIDDDESHRLALTTILKFIGENCCASSSADCAVATSQLEPGNTSLALIGRLEAGSLEPLLAHLHEWEAGLPFVLLGEHEIPQDLPAPLLTRITARLDDEPSYQPLLDALHKGKLFHEHFNRLRDVGGVRDFNMFHSLVGQSAAIQKVRHMMGQVASKEVSVLITGESGTGKEVVARNLHLNSSRAEKPFVPINCGAIPRELLESELFGHVKGAFTGAISDRAGRFELADGGTLFLDEIGDMPLSMQVKLLRVLQERSFERVGGVKTIQADVRILAATHKDLEDMIDAGEFRQDLYYRLNVFPIEVPPLRERADDVPLLLNELISQMEAEQRGSVRFNSAAIARLRDYHWPGNVRELANLIERMAILYPHSIVGVNDLPEKFRQEKARPQPVAIDSGDSSEAATATEGGDSEAPDMPAATSLEENLAAAAESGSLLPMNGLDLKEYLNNLERDLIEQALDDSDGVVARAADRLHIGRTTLVEKMRKFNLARRQAEEKQARDAEEAESPDSDGGGSADNGGERGQAASA
jgi:sigma-54 specific flagellar transcriptional regulator A